MQLMKEYQESISKILADITEKEAVSIKKAADLLSDCYAEDRLIHVFGAGGIPLLERWKYSGVLAV